MFNRQLKWGKPKTANDYGQFSIACILEYIVFFGNINVKNTHIYIYLHTYIHTYIHTYTEGKTYLFEIIHDGWRVSTPTIDCDRCI